MKFFILSIVTSSLIACSSAPPPKYGPLKTDEIKSTQTMTKAKATSDSTQKRRTTPKTLRYQEYVPPESASKNDIVKHLGAPNFTVRTRGVDYMHYCGTRDACLKLEKTLRGKHDIAPRQKCVKVHTHIENLCHAEPPYGFIAAYPRDSETKKRLGKEFEKFTIPWKMPTNLDGAEFY